MTDASCRHDGGTGDVRPSRAGRPGRWASRRRRSPRRIAYAAAHVVPQPLADNIPGAPAVIDWDATLAYRHELWSYGLGVADAMDTAQRGMGLDWAATQRADQAIRGGGGLGRRRDRLRSRHRPAGPGRRALRRGRAAGRHRRLPRADRPSARRGRHGDPDGSRALAAAAGRPRTTCRSTPRCSSEVDRPVILHWLGPMFDPAPGGLLGQRHRRRGHRDLPQPDRGPRRARSTGSRSRCWTPPTRSSLRAACCRPGSGCTPETTSTTPSSSTATATHHSDALLGIFAAIYPAASTALQAYDAGDPARGRAILDSTAGAGPAHLQRPDAVLQDRDGVPVLAERSAGRLQHGRRAAVRPLDARTSSRPSELADQAGLLLDPALAAHRMPIPARSQRDRSG